MDIIDSRKQEMKKDLNNMEEIMIKLGDRSDIWQDRFIYWIAKALRDLLVYHIIH